MQRNALEQVEAALASLERQTHGQPGEETLPGSGKSSAFGRRIRKILFRTLTAAVLIGSSFMVLIRFSVSVYLSEGVPAWGALALGAVLTTLVLAGTAVLVRRWILGRWRLSWGLLRWSGLLVLLFCGYGLLFISGAHVKTPALRSTYTALHPLLRMAVSTWVLVDPSAVVTDMGRVPEDYARMGLPALESSLHYRQEDGFVHALDIRTKASSEVRNTLKTFYFAAMGFHTLRHTGTANHLHVALPTLP